MKKLLRIIAITLLLSSSLKAQDCNCLSEFNYTKAYFEQNHPGFQLNIKHQPDALKAYESAAGSMRKKIEAANPKENCIFFLEGYIALLKDHHISIDPSLSHLRSIDESSETAVHTFLDSEEYKSHEHIPFDSLALVTELQRHPQDSVEGLYQFGPGNLIAVFENKTAERDYVGIVLQSTSKLWKPGQVKIELKWIEGNTYDITVYTRSFSKVCERSVIRQGKIPAFGISKAGLAAQHLDESPFDFKPIDDRTSYLRLSSFDGSLYNQLDSFYTSINEQIRSKPNLIIDIRDNGGGSEQCFFPLLKYAYTRPMNTDTLELWVTEDNIKSYQRVVNQMQGDSLRYGATAIQKMEKIVQRMIAAERNTFIPMGEEMPQPIVFDSILAYPQKIVLLHNRGTASSAEGLVFYLSQSDKVMTAGENTGGYVGFGNVQPSPTPGGCYILNCTTMKYGSKYKYEFSGLPPQYPIGAETEEEILAYCLELFLFMR